MEDAALHPATPRYALVTGANRGIGFEICRQLASKGIMVILASRDEKRGIAAQQRLLKELNTSDDNSNHTVIFHHLDVTDPASVAAVADFIGAKFGRLDILVNNAGVLGVAVDGDALVLEEQFDADVALVYTGEFHQPSHKASGTVFETFEGAKECIETNYYGAKRVTQALIPLLQKSNSPRIVNVSSTLGSLVLQPNEWAKGVWRDEENLTEEGIDRVVQEFLKSFEEGRLEEKHWPLHISAYKVSKASLNAYTRLMARKHEALCINSVCPGYTRTELTHNLGSFSDAEGAEAPVRLALLPEGGPTGSVFLRHEALSYS